MKFTIEGFSQKRAVELGLSVEDLVILRWFVDFFPSEKMIKMVHNGKTYALVSYSGFIEQMPIISCNKRTIARKFQRLVESNVLENETIKQGGSFSVYRFGSEYESLIANETAEQSCATGMYNVVQPPMYKNVHTNTNLYNSTNLINTNTPYNPPVGESCESVVQCNEEFEEQPQKPKRKQKASNDEITEKAQSVIAYLNEKTSQRFNTKTKGNLSKAVARLKEGYTVDDLKAVVDFKVAAWMGTDMQQYLRPETLFAPTKFDGYLNAARMGFNSKPTNYSSGYQKPQYESISAKHKREEEETRRKIKSGEYIPAPWEEGYEE